MSPASTAGGNYTGLAQLPSCTQLQPGRGIAFDRFSMGDFLPRKLCHKLCPKARGGDAVAGSKVPVTKKRRKTRDEDSRRRQTEALDARGKRRLAGNMERRGGFDSESKFVLTVDVAKQVLIPIHVPRSGARPRARTLCARSRAFCPRVLRLDRCHLDARADLKPCVDSGANEETHQ